jgi:hypothetical protein
LRFVVVAVLMFSLLPQYAWGHETFRVIGTVSHWEASVLVVKEKDGSPVTMSVPKETAVSRDGKEVGAGALKLGLRVVVDATDYGNTIIADAIRIVPAE